MADYPVIKELPSAPILKELPAAPVLKELPSAPVLAQLPEVSPMTGKDMPTSADLTKTGNIHSKQDLFDSGAVKAIGEPGGLLSVPGKAIGAGAEWLANKVSPGQQFVKAAPIESAVNTAMMGLGAKVPAEAAIRPPAATPPATSIPKPETPPPAAPPGAPVALPSTVPATPVLKELPKVEAPLSAAAVEKTPHPVNRADVSKIDTEHWQSQGREHARLITANDALNKLTAEEKTPENKASMLAQAQGDPEHVPTPGQKALHEESIVPLQKTLWENFKRLKAMMLKQGRSEDEIDALSFDKNHLPRIPVRYARELELKLKDEEEGPLGGSKGASLTEPAELQQRRYFLRESADGNRVVMRRQDKGDYVDAEPDFQGKKVTMLGTQGKTVGDKFTHMGKEYTLKHATIREIEEATKGSEEPENYIKDPHVALHLGNLHIERAIDEMEYTQNKRAEMIQDGHATENPKMAKQKGYEETRVSGFKGLYVEPRLKAALDRWRAPKKDSGIEGTIAANNFITRTLFGIPIPHIINVGTGFIADLHLDSPGTLAQAWRDMDGKSGFYQKAQEAGLSLWSSRKKAQAFYDASNKLVSELSGIDPPAKTAIQKAAEPVAKVWGASHDAMAYAQDVMMLSQVRSYMKGGALRHPLGIEDAAEMAMKSVPSYRIATETAHPGTGEGMAKLSRAPSAASEHPLGRLLNNFSRYHYGLIQQAMKPFEAVFRAGTAAKDASTGKGFKPRTYDTEAWKAQRALKQAVLLSFGTAVVMPYMHEAYKKLTGDQRAEMTYHGAMAVMKAMGDLVHGKNPLRAAARLSGITPSPAAGAIKDVGVALSGELHNTGKKAQAEGSTAETPKQLLYKLLMDVPIFEQEEQVRTALTGAGTAGQKAAKAVLPLTTGLSHTPYPTTPRANIHPPVRIR